MEEKKTLFHSEFVRACERGPVVITVLSEAQASKFQGKPPYAKIKFEKREREYWCDTEPIARFFDGQVGRSFAVMAEGGKGEEMLSWVGEAASQPAEKGRNRKREGKAPPTDKKEAKEGKAPPRSETAAAPAQTTAHTGGRTPETAEQIETRYSNAIRDMKILAGRHMMLAAIASDAAQVVADRHALKHGVAMSEERIQGIAMRIMIALGDRAITLPSNPIEKWLPFEAPKAPQSVQPSDNDGGNPK